MNGFRKALNPESNLEEEVDEEEDDDELSDLGSLPGDVIDALERFEFISDEEFDGFNDK